MYVCLFSKVSMRYHFLLVISSVSFVPVSILGCFFVMGGLSIYQRVVSYSIYKKVKVSIIYHTPQDSKPKFNQHVQFHTPHKKSSP